MGKKGIRFLRTPLAKNIRFENPGIPSRKQNGNYKSPPVWISTVGYLSSSIYFWLLYLYITYAAIVKQLTPKY